MDTSVGKIHSDALFMFSESPSQEQLQHLLQAQKSVLEKIVHGQELTAILPTLCRDMERVITPSCCSIKLLDHQANTLHLEAGPTVPKGLLAIFEELVPGNPSSACSLAVECGKAVSILNSQSEPHWDMLPAGAEKYGIQACWSIPIFSKPQNPIGTFSVLLHQLRKPSPIDLFALETASHLAALAIQHHEAKQEAPSPAQTQLDSAPVAYFTSTMGGRILSANARTAELTGIPQHQLLGQSVIDLFSPSLRGRKKAERIHQWINHGLEIDGEELELELPDGTRRWVTLTVSLIRDSMGNPLERQGILEDISNRKQAEHLLAEQNSVLEMIARGQSLHNTLYRLCQGVETLAPNINCSVHRLEGTKLRLLAAPSLPKAYTSKVESLEIGPAAGSCGTAAYRKEVVVVSDIATDSLWNRGRNLALRHGLQACWSIPILSSDNEVLGTMAMYYPQPRTPRREDWEIIESSTKLAGIALEQDRDRTALTQSEGRYRTLYEDNPTMYFTVAIDGTVRSVNQFGASQLGFTPSELVDSSVFSICHPEDLETVRSTFESYIDAPTGLSLLEFRKVRKDGSIIWVRETIRMVQSTEQESVLLLVCEDITVQKQIEETLVSGEQAIRRLYDITSSPKLSFEERIRALLRLGCERFNLPMGMVTHGIGDNLIVQYVHAGDSDFSEGISVPLHKTFCGSTMSASDPIGIEHTSESDWKTHQGYTTLGLECYLGTKVTIGPEIYGTLCFGDQHPYQGKFSEADKDFLQLMARWIGTELEQIRAQEALQSIVEGTGSISSVDFFHTLTRALAQCLDVRYAFITEWSDPGQTTLHTLSFWNGDRIAENFEYELAGTPCQVVMEGQVCFYAKNVQAQFPKDKDLHNLGVESYLGIPLFNDKGDTIGHLVAMDCHPLPTETESIPVLKIFAARAAVELERKRVEDALRRSESRLRQVIDLVPHFIFAKDKNGRFILANQAVAEVYGTTVQNLIGKTDADFCPSPKEVEHFRHDDLEVLATGNPKSVEECITDSEGKVRYLQTTKIPFVFADSVLPSILGIAIDITDLKQGQEDSRLTQHVFDILPDHVSVVGPDYRYRRVNSTYEQVHGLPAQELIGRHVSDLLGKQIFLNDVKPYLDRCLSGEVVSYEQWFHFKEGKKRFMAVTYSPLRSKDQPQVVEAVVVNARDLTSRKQMEEALKESEGHLRILLDERTRISQDLHDHVLQSLYAVGLIIAAIRKPLENQEFSEVYEFLNQAVSQVNHSISEIRGFIEGLPQGTRDIGDFSTELNHLVQSMSLPDGPKFQVRIDQDAVELLSKQNILHLLNIARESMSNCLRHAQASKGSIRLTRKNDNLRFEIHDNGIGFNPKEVTQSGHGLLNMKARSKQLKGTILIRSAPNKGTRVIINIPIRTQTRRK